MNDSSPKTMSVFGQALECESIEEREVFVERACGDDAELRANVEDLLQAHLAAGNFLRGHSTPARLVTTVDEPVCELTGTVIGPYKLMEQIGEGGMGLVFVAEQQQPVRRKVALKVIKPGTATREVISRFEAERQALALMDHPNIAKVLDAGATESGQPYFVMELVRGVPITDYCDQAQLAPRERLELFVNVCQAVQHAHQKGIIHRDIKPSNVLVTLHDGQPVAKVIDFGVAKAIGQPLTEHTVYTRFAQMSVTPLYMSPEQAEMSGMDIDTRSDIYSLGVLLYELLTGTTPFDKDRLRRVGFDEMRRIIREEEPPKPSTRLSTLKQSPTIITTNRNSDPNRLSRFVRGDLDWIVMKALAKSRADRYDTAKEMADDVERFLEDRPVQARPPTFGDRVRKWSRRHKALVRAASVVCALAIIALAVGALVLRSKNVELAAVNGKEREQRQLADANFKKARDVVEKMFSRVGKELGNHPHMEKIRRDILEQALGFYEDFLKQAGHDPELRSETADAYLRTGEIHRMLRQLDLAEQDCQRAIQIMEELVNEQPTSFEYRKQLFTAYSDLANTIRETGRFQDAEPWLRRTLTTIDQAGRDFPDNPEPARRSAATHGNLGMLLWQAKRLEESQQEYDLSIGAFEQLLARYPEEAKYQSDLALGYVNRGSLLEAMGRMSDAEKSIRAALALLEKIQPSQADEFEHPKRLSYAHAWLGDVVKDRGALAEAEQHYGKCIPIYEKLRDRFPATITYAFDLAMIKNNLGLVLTHLRPADAEAVYLQAIAIWQRYAKELPKDPAEFPKWQAFSLTNLAFHFSSSPDLRLRNPRRALDYAKQAFELAPQEAPIWHNLGMAYYRNGNPAAALPALQKAIDLSKGNSSPSSYFLAMTYWQLDRKEDARKTLARAQHDAEKDAKEIAKDWFQAEEIRRARAEATALIAP